MAINKLKTLSALALAFGTQVATASADELTTQVDTILVKVSEKITSSEKTNITDLVQEISDNVELEINSLELTDAEKAELAIQVQDQILQYSKEENVDSVFMKALSAKIEASQATIVEPISTETPITVVDPIAEEPVELTEHTDEETKSPTEIVEVLETEPVLDPEVEIDTTPQTATETSAKVYTTQKEIDAKSGTYYYNKDKVKGTAVEITEAEAKKLGLAHSLLDGEKPAEKPAETTPSTDTSSSTSTTSSTTNTNPANAQVRGAGINPGTTSSSSTASSSTASSTTASNAPTATSSTASNSSENPNTSRSVSPSVTSQTTSSTTSSTQDSLPVTGDTPSNIFSFVGVAMLAAAGLMIKKRKEI